MLASEINQKNYHLLGNRATGETKQSRMHRVNSRQVFSPSLVNQNNSKQLKINGAKPLNLGKSENTFGFPTPRYGLGTFPETVTRSIVTGAVAFAVNAFLRTERGHNLIKLAPTKAGRKDSHMHAVNSAALALAAGLGGGLAYTGGFPDGNLISPSVYDATAAISVLIAGRYGSPLVSLLTDRRPARKERRIEKNFGLLMSVPLALGVYGSKAPEVLSMYAAALSGIGISSQYRKMRRA